MIDHSMIQQSCLLPNISDKFFSLFSSSAAHLKSKKHHYHVRKKRKSDPACDQSHVTAAHPVCGAETAERLSSDSCVTVAPGIRETSQESSHDTTKTHKEVPVTL